MYFQGNLCDDLERMAWRAKVFDQNTTLRSRRWRRICACKQWQGRWPKSTSTTTSSSAGSRSRSSTWRQKTKTKTKRMVKKLNGKWIGLWETTSIQMEIILNKDQFRFTPSSSTLFSWRPSNRQKHNLIAIVKLLPYSSPTLNPSDISISAWFKHSPSRALASPNSRYSRSRERPLSSLRSKHSPPRLLS